MTGIEVPSRRLPRRRWPVIVVLGVIAVAIAAAIVSISIGEGGRQVRITGASETQGLFGGILQEGNELGSPDAPVSLSLYTDLLCEPCARHYMELVPPLVDGPVRDGELRLSLHHFSIGENETTVPALAAIAAGFQDKQWQYSHLFVSNLENLEDRVTREFLEGVAGAVLELDTGRWSEDVDSQEAVARSEADAASVRRLDLFPVPAVVVEGPGGSEELAGFPSLEEVEKALAEVE